MRADVTTTRLSGPARLKNTNGLAGLRAEVFFNLHSGLFSVRALSGADKGKVVAHVESFEMRDVSFVVQPAGRAKVLRDRKKNVHAFVRGTLTLGAINESLARGQWGARVRYNPYESDSFVGMDGVPVKTAQASFGRVMIGDTQGKPRVYAIN